MMCDVSVPQIIYRIAGNFRVVQNFRGLVMISENKNREFFYNAHAYTLEPLTIASTLKVDSAIVKKNKLYSRR